MKINRIEVKSRQELRLWFKKNFNQSESIWLVTFKKSVSRYYLPYDEIVDEALCFGWIDSQPRSLDEKRSMRLLSPRKPKSNWSLNNKNRVKRLIREGLMTKAGLAAVEVAKENGAWKNLDQVEKLKLPSDLKAAFVLNKAAESYFKKFPPSSQRLILEWINNSKTDDTRKKRIIETVSKAEKNIRANHYRQPKGKR